MTMKIDISEMKCKAGIEAIERMVVPVHFEVDDKVWLVTE